MIIGCHVLLTSNEYVTPRWLVGWVWLHWYMSIYTPLNPLRVIIFQASRCYIFATVVHTMGLHYVICICLAWSTPLVYAPSCKDSSEHIG